MDKINDINFFDKEGSLYFKKITRKDEIGKDERVDGYLISSSEKEARRIIDKLKGSGKLIAIEGGDDNFNRRVIETMKVDYLVSPEKGEKSDSLKQRDSGLNIYLSKKAKERKISIVINVGELTKLKDYGLAQRISRIIQNIKICRKTGCDIKLASFSHDEKGTFNEIDRREFGLSLGMSTTQAKNSTDMTKKI